MSYPMRRPIGGRLDPNHPLLRGCIASFTPDGIRSKHDFLTGKNITVGTGVSFPNVPNASNRSQGFRQYAKGDATANGGFAETIGIQGPSQWSVLCVFVPAATSDGYVIGMADSPGSTTHDRAIIYSRTGADEFEVYEFDGALKYATPPTGYKTIIRGAVNVGVGRCDGSTMYASLNGSPEGTTAVSNGGYTGYTAANTVIDVIYKNNNPRAMGVLLGLFHNRCITPGEVRAFHENPWQIFADPIRRSIYAAAGGGGGGGGGRRRQIIAC